MSDERLREVEKDVAIIKTVISPLVEKIDKGTTATTELTHEIKALVKQNDSMLKVVNDIEGRVQTIEDSRNTEKAGRDFAKWLFYAAAGLFVLGAGTLGSHVIGDFYAHKQVKQEVSKDGK